jgi:hypothetical protein
LSEIDKLQKRCVKCCPSDSQEEVVDSFTVYVDLTSEDVVEDQAQISGQEAVEQVDATGSADEGGTVRGLQSGKEFHKIVGDTNSDRELLQESANQNKLRASGQQRTELSDFIPVVDITISDDDSGGVICEVDSVHKLVSPKVKQHRKRKSVDIKKSLPDLRETILGRKRCGGDDSSNANVVTSQLVILDTECTTTMCRVFDDFSKLSTMTMVSNLYY